MTEDEKKKARQRKDDWFILYLGVGLVLGISGAIALFKFI